MHPRTEIHKIAVRSNIKLESVAEMGLDINWEILTKFRKIKSSIPFHRSVVSCTEDVEEKCIVVENALAQFLTVELPYNLQN